MDITGKKLGVLISVAPGHPNFQRAVRLAQTALNRDVSVYLYCIDDGVQGIGDPSLQALKQRGLKLFGCAYAAQRRNLPLSDEAVFSGLGMLGDIISGTDRFVSFN